MKKVSASLLATILPLCCFAINNTGQFHSGAVVISICNFILLITSLVCIFQYFVPSAEDHTVFHAINLILIIVFYWISLSFLINHKEYYSGYEHLSPIGCVKKIFFTFNLYVLKHWIIFFAGIINILYIIKLKPQEEVPEPMV